jgi:hypothetical protein
MAVVKTQGIDPVKIALSCREAVKVVFVAKKGRFKEPRKYRF